jgi:2,5-dihydroxypyridine 5,6-dioxygenase
MHSPGAYRGARRLLEVCAALTAGESVAIVTDTNRVDIAALVAGQAFAAGAEPTLFVMAPRDVDGEEPTALTAAALTEADLVVLLPTFSFAHSAAVRAALAAGARVVSMPACNDKLLAAGGLYADFHAYRPICREVAAIFTAGSSVSVESAAGTSVTMSIADRNGNSHDCIADAPGQFTAVPNIEANVSPVEGTAEGTIVFDASIPNLGIGVLVDPVRLTVREGRVVEISGGHQAKLLERAWEERHNALVYNIAQLAVGLNPECRETTGQLTNDHGVLGTMHFGIGTSESLGGHTHASMHIDGIMSAATVRVDGEPILLDGAPAGPWAEGLDRVRTADRAAARG